MLPGVLEAEELAGFLVTSGCLNQRARHGHPLKTDLQDSRAPIQSVLNVPHCWVKSASLSESAETNSSSCECPLGPLSHLFACAIFPSVQYLQLNNQERASKGPELAWRDVSVVNRRSGQGWFSHSQLSLANSASGQEARPSTEQGAIGHCCSVTNPVCLP